MSQLFDQEQNNIFVGSIDKLPEWSKYGEEQEKAVEKVKLMLKNYLELDNVSFLFGSGSSIHLGAVSIRNFPREVEDFIRVKDSVAGYEGIYKKFIYVIRRLQSSFLSENEEGIDPETHIFTDKNGWKTDISFTTGGNSQIYNVVNTYNRSLGANSPIQFRPGGYKFQHNVGNIDISKPLSSKVSLGFGSEVRIENFEIIAGDEASYIQGPLTDFAPGANSFPGIRPENAGLFTRYNLGAYADLGVDLTKDFLINGTARFENYSDFGDAFVWKVSSRYKMNDDKVTLRASASTGFRAPSLHQINLQATQASFIDGTIKDSGVFRNGCRTSLQDNLWFINSNRNEKFGYLL